MSNKITQTRFASICGVSRQAISKAVKAKKIKIVEKKVDCGHRLTNEYYYSQTGKILKIGEIASKVTPAPRKKKPAATPDNKTLIKNQKNEVSNTGKDDDDGYTLPNGIKCLDDINETNLHKIPIDYLKKIKDLETAKKTKQDREHKRNTLIDRELVEMFLSKLYTVDTNQWKSLPDRVNSKICEIFGFIDESEEAIKSRKVIDKEIVKTLKLVKRLINTWINKHKEI